MLFVIIIIYIIIFVRLFFFILSFVAVVMNSYEYGGKLEQVLSIKCTFRGGENVIVGNLNFWEEFFLLKPKMAALEGEIGALQVKSCEFIRSKAPLFN